MTPIRLGIVRLAAVALVVFGCGGRQAPADAQTTVLSLKAMDCSGCGEDLVRKLREEDGVHSAKFDRTKAELTVVAEPSYDALARARVLKGDEEFEVIAGPGQGGYLPWAQPQGGDVKTIAENGADLPNLTSHLVGGKVTVFDFSAIWCEPCRVLDEHMLEVVKKRDDVAYRKLDVGDWDTPLANRYLKGVRQLPYVIVYDKNGKVVSQITGLDVQGLEQAIAKGSN